jgi:hypothetical protein
MLRIPKPDGEERPSMSSESAADGRGDRGAETTPTPAEALDRQLRSALEAAEEEETRFHLRQALQLVKALDRSRP